MKRGIQLFALAAAVVVAGGLVAPDAEATCPGLKQFSSGDRAFNYNYVYQGYVSGLRLGFDPRFADCGAGTVLMCHMLQDSFERGDNTFDFLPGFHGWRHRLRTGPDNRLVKVDDGAGHHPRFIRRQKGNGFCDLGRF